VAKARKSGRSAIVVGVGKERRVETENSPREHGGFSHVIASSSTVFYSTGTIFRCMSNCRGSEIESQKLNVECPEKKKS
jgi:hypothetical protein